MHAARLLVSRQPVCKKLGIEDKHDAPYNTDTCTGHVAEQTLRESVPIHTSPSSCSMKRRKRHRKDAPKRTALAAWGTQVPTAPYYEFRELLRADPALRRYLKVGELGDLHAEVGAQDARLALTRAILRHFFSLSFTLPAGHLVPIVPGRVQYLRWAASLLPTGANARCLTVIDVGTGPSAIYSLLGARMFAAWRFVATDIDGDAIAVANSLVESNMLQSSIRVVRTDKNDSLLSSTLWEEEEEEAPPALTVCNPPFFKEGTRKDDAIGIAPGTHSQMETPGGECEFVRRLARDSVDVSHVGIFTCLVGVHADLPSITAYIKSEEIRASHVVSVTLDAGGRTTRWAIAWHFGPTHSKVDLAAPQSACEWRAPLCVLPGRRYANRLTPGALLSIWKSAMVQLNWMDEEKGDDAPGKSTVRTCRMRKTESWSVVVGKCGSRNYDGSFSLMLAVEKRGELALYDVFGIANEVCREMRAIMNVD